MSDYKDFKNSLLGLFANDLEFRKELPEVQAYYEFYEGRRWTAEEDYESTRGQLWGVRVGDYTPTREIRNLTKKLLNKQGRFMTSVPPTLVLSSYDDNVNRDSIDTKRACIEHMLRDTKFWNKFGKAFMDCTIGKRVLLCMLADVDQLGVPTGEIKFRFYTMPEFIYEYDENDVDVLRKVEIAYQDKSTIGKIQRDQRWHKWTYEMREDGYCWATYKIVDGANITAFTTVTNNVSDNEDDDTIQAIELKQEWNTGLEELPCKVILNDGLTGDIRGHSDVKDLMDMAMDYNKTMSDYRDALRFKMFEQPVFTDVKSSSLKNIKIAPNKIIDLKSDPTLGDGTGSNSVAKFGTLSSTFSFQAAADSYLTQLKKDMYELMEQPMPEALLNIPSAKALKMVYYDLITRCEEKWRTWNEVLIWVVHMFEVYGGFGLFKEVLGSETLTLETTTSWTHNYPIPDDDESVRTIAIQEVEANVRSHKSYIEEYGNSEDADAEFERIMEEQEQIQNMQNMMMGGFEPNSNTQEGEENNEGEENDKNNKGEDNNKNSQK